jgi:hypothetical protein
LHPQALHPTQQQPQALGHQLGVTLTLDVEVAVEGAVAYRTFHMHRLGQRMVLYIFIIYIYIYTYTERLWGRARLYMEGKVVYI